MKWWHLGLIVVVLGALAWFFRPQIQPAIENRLAVYEEPAQEESEEAQDTSGGLTEEETAEWVELEQEFEEAGNLKQTFNVDHDGDVHRQTLVWFWADFGYDLAETGCSMVAITNPDGARVTTIGAKRTWKWTGESAPTQAQRQQLVDQWDAVLRVEPRGSCQKGYTVSWQNAEAATATDKPETVKPTPAPRREPTATPTTTAEFDPSDLDSVLIQSGDLPQTWSPSGAGVSNLAICWGNARITVHTTQTTLQGDACRLWVVQSESEATAVVGWFSEVLETEYPDVSWSLVQ